MFRSPAEMRAFASRYTAAWCSQDASSVATFFSPSGSLTINGGMPALGRDAITKAAQSFMTAFPDLQVTQDDVFVKGDWVEYHWRRLPAWERLIGISQAIGGDWTCTP
jgi:uncharacterized protein (TIGR02246 family)